MALDERILNAKNDPSEMDLLITDYKSFILATISKTLKKYIHQDDASLTTGMLGFHEAVLNYDSSKGSFISYAQIVIRSRILDELRSDNRQTQNFVLYDTKLDEESNIYGDLDKRSIEIYEQRKIEDQRKDDIVVYKEVLKSWNLTIEDLVALSPKKKALLSIYQSIGREIAQNQDLMFKLQETRRLPAKYILQHYKIDRKKLDRGRKYIIAVVELWAGDFETLKPYISGR